MKIVPEASKSHHTVAKRVLEYRNDGQVHSAENFFYLPQVTTGYPMFFSPNYLELVRITSDRQGVRGAERSRC